MNLNDKAIKIQGKSYVLVSDRILYFNETYKDGCITTDLVKYEDKQIIIKATVYPEWLQGRNFTGYSQSIEWQGYINKTSALENAETSAVGRALAMMGIWVIDSIASVDEINKAKGAEATKPVDQLDKPNFGKRNMDNLKAAIEKWERKKNKEETLAYLEATYNLKDDARGWTEEYFDRLPNVSLEIPEQVATDVKETFNS